MRLVISFNLTYRSYLKDVRFSSYVRFCLYSPNHPWGTPNCPALEPHTSTPLGPSPIKLSQRAAQIRGPFFSSSSRLGVAAPALFVWPFWCPSSRLKRCSTFCVIASFLFLSAEGASSLTFAMSLLLCLASSALAGSHDQYKMAAAMAAVRESLSTLELAIFHSGSFLLVLNRLCFYP